MHKNLKMPILELRGQGKSYRQIENELKCSRTVIHHHCSRHNLTDTGKKRYPIQDDMKFKIADFCKNHSKKEAQKYFNLSKSTIFKYYNFEIKDEQK